MIWRIVRKDWRQLWPLVAIVAMAQVTNAALWFSLGHFNEPRGLVIVAQRVFDCDVARDGRADRGRRAARIDCPVSRRTG